MLARLWAAGHRNYEQNAQNPLFVTLGSLVGTIAVLLGFLEMTRSSWGHGIFTTALGAALLVIYVRPLVGLIQRHHTG